MTFGVCAPHLMDLVNQNGSWVKLGDIMMFLVIRIIQEQSISPSELAKRGQVRDYAETSHQAKSLRGADDL